MFSFIIPSGSFECQSTIGLTQVRDWGESAKIMIGRTACSAVIIRESG
jgi:hypothetical protein